MQPPQKIKSIAAAKLAALITIPIQPTVSRPSSNALFATFQQSQVQNKLSRMFI